MTEMFFGFASSYGLPVIAITAFLSCLAIPIPTFAVMLSGGAFAATGDLVLWHVLLTAHGAALLGDQTGFQIGRWGGPRVVARLGRNRKRAVLIARAQDTIHKWGGLGVFFSTWLFAPLGPWVNLAAGTVQLGWLRFTAWDAAGEAIWVLVYVMLGFIFAAQLPELVDIVGEWAGLVSSGAVAGLMGSLLICNFKRLYKRTRT